MMSDRATFVSFLLDETGSMSSIADDTVHGLNTYVEKLQEGDANIVFSLVSFNSNETRRRHVAEPVRSVPPMEREDYRPDAMTPLIDAAVKIIRATDEAVRHREDDPNVVVVMQTDGKENASVEHTHGDLALLIKEKTAAGWQFVFLGAGLDAFAVARQAGIDIHPGQVVSYGRAMSREVFAETAQNLSDFAESGDADFLSFSPRQRERVGDVHTPAHLERRRSRGSAARKVRGSKASTVEEIDLTRS
jgi:hypothetical protein